MAALVNDLGRQASTLAYPDGFILITWVCVGMICSPGLHETHEEPFQ
jgi:hypothetical protein